MYTVSSTDRVREASFSTYTHMKTVEAHFNHFLIIISSSTSEDQVVLQIFQAIPTWTTTPGKEGNQSLRLVLHRVQLRLRPRRLPNELASCNIQTMKMPTLYL